MKRVYTSNGDKGFTRDYGGREIPKDDLIILINGKIDSLQSALDMAMFLDGEHSEFLKIVQQKLWQASGEVANCSGDCLNAPITDEDLKNLEAYIDSLGESPNKFVRFTDEKSIWFNECRVRCRELETFLVKLFREGKLRSEVYRYVNRLSSLFFMMGYKSG
jgi:cob(I)alamin adenosyltransferase